ncbi:MAG TPA: hypothetical protein VGB50_03870 [Flavobacterium sp.]
MRKEHLFSFNHFFAFVSIEQNKITRFVVDYCDPDDISQEAYDWCDVYAKINFNKEQETQHAKLVVIPPSFGIKMWNLPQTLYYCAANLLASSFSVPTKKRIFIKDYWQTYRREKLEKFLSPEKNNTNAYIFLTATLWTADEYADNTNHLRKYFIDTCRQLNEVEFEGGLYATPEHPKFDEFKSVAIPKQYALKKFIRKNKLSAISFNTPAVHNCHGWKLAEYMAMGKAIISTKLSYDFPNPLIHGINIHFIASQNEMRDAVIHLLRDNIYRKTLEKNAQKYFLENMTPSKVLTAIINKAK